MHLIAGVKGIGVQKQLHEPIANDRVYLPMTWRMEAAVSRVGDFVEAEYDTCRGGWLGLWDILQQCNKALRCEFWEGVVAKRNDSIYPRQNRSHDVEFPFWMKHRWAF